MTNKVIVHIYGGVVQNVYANCNVEVEVIDLDDEEDEETIKKGVALLNQVEEDESFEIVW